MGNKPELTAHDHAELLAVYQSTIGDIAYFKSQQWHITNYGILIYGAIVATAKLVKEGFGLFGGSLAVLFVLAVATLLSGLFVLNELETSLRKARGRLDRSVELFTPLIYKEIFQGPVRADDKSTLIRFFQLVLVSGFLIVSWILWIWGAWS